MSDMHLARIEVGGSHAGYTLNGEAMTDRQAADVMWSMLNLPASETVPRAVAEMAREFASHPNALRNPPKSLWRTLNEEEGIELLDALDNGGRWEVARELADVVYVAYGTALLFGIDLDVALREIHRAAMDKMEANVRREDGKIVKPPGFVPPDMSAALKSYREAVPDGD